MSGAEVSAVVEQRTVTVITLRSGHEWAKFVVDDQPQAHHLTVESSYGGWSYIWGCPGGDFLVFLSSLDASYAGGKMCQGEHEVFDPERTTRRIRGHICQYRRDGTYDAAFARQEWGNLAHDIEHEVDFHDWMHRTAIDCAYEFWRTSPGPRFCDFVLMHKLFWAPFARAVTDESNESE